MRKLLFIATMVSFMVSVISCNKDNSNQPVNPADTVTVSMEAGYQNDVYYSMSNGVVSQAPSDEWDIAFFTDIRSSSIRTNVTKGIKLYTYPDGDTTAWNETLTIDSAKLANYLYNSDTSWTTGAFDRNELGFPDYGWGVYNQVNHDVVGDSIFIIQLADQSFRKLWIVRKNSVNNIYYFKFANLDGTDETEAALDCNNYITKNFAYYSIANKKEIDHEPAKTDWDLVFTQYTASINMGPGGIVPYGVTGVLSNINTSVAKIDGLPSSKADYSGAQFKSEINTIGYDWKSINMETYQYSIVDSLTYFVKTQSGDIYKLNFTDFGGSTNGSTTFAQKKVQ